MPGLFYIFFWDPYQRGKYHCMSDLMFDWFGLDQTSKTVVNSAEAKQLNLNKQSMRLAIQR